MPADVAYVAAVEGCVDRSNKSNQGAAEERWAELRIQLCFAYIS